MMRCAPNVLIRAMYSMTQTTLALTLIMTYNSFTLCCPPFLWFIWRTSANKAQFVSHAEYRYERDMVE